MRLEPRPRHPAPLVLAIASALLILATAGAGAVAAASSYVSNCGVNLRASASTSGTVVAVISTGTTVTASGTVSGSSWAANCATSVSGSTWYAITAVNGKTTSSLYGRAQVYAATGLFSSAPPPPPPSSYLEGIDVSHWQGSINWPSVATAGKKFAVMKVTEAQTFVDSQYAAWHTAARSVGIRVGGYHFADPTTSANDAVKQADWFVAHLSLTSGDLNPALDLENSGGLGTAALQAWVGAWLNEVYAKTGMRPMIYTSPSFWRTYMGDSIAFANAGYTVLWVAHWFVSSPSVPANNWGGKSWTFWQYSDCGSVPGISGCVDLDRYNGTDLTKVTYAPSFAVSASPASTSVKQGAGADLSITIQRTYFTSPVSLSVSGLPAGAAATFAAATTSGTSTTLHLATSASGTVTPVGTYPLTITASGSGSTHTAKVTLVVTDGVAPSVNAPASRLYSISLLAATTTPAQTIASASDPSGIASYAMEWQQNNGTWSGCTLSSSAPTTCSQSLAFGSVYRFRGQATDKAGNTSSWVMGPNVTPQLTQQAASTVTFGAGWVNATSTNYSGGSAKYTRTKGASATFTFSGAAMSWVAYRGPNRGWAQVYVDGTYVTTVNLYASVYLARQVVFSRAWATNGNHRVTIVALGTAGHPGVDVDAFVRFVLS